VIPFDMLRHWGRLVNSPVFWTFWEAARRDLT